MTSRTIAVSCLAFLFAAPIPDVCQAGTPSASDSDVDVTIIQNPSRSRCIWAFDPDVVRLCPGGTGTTPFFDRVTFQITVRDDDRNNLPGVLVEARETSGNVNIAEGGSTSAVTDGVGRATILLTAASGYGIVSVCAAGVALGEVEVRSPDVARGPGVAQCDLPSSQSSFVSFADYANPVCGFSAHYGPVTPGINNWWDLNCNGYVDGVDLIGQLGTGGLLQHFGHGAGLGSTSTCP